TIDRFTWFVYGATLVFFAVLFVGFAYEWKTGAFDWVRAVTAQRAARPAPASRAPPAEHQPVLSP
ncbi:MAG: NAD(P)H-quinone oxidoreductase subunit 3, partial [Planctomycetales bacterium]|nr:NAD(P)H-quinone oxidoreductase subunit 3 [Planctomycetales bacterium]